MYQLKWYFKTKEELNKLAGSCLNPHSYLIQTNEIKNDYNKQESRIKQLFIVQL